MLPVFLSIITIPITLAISLIFIFAIRTLDVFETESLKNIFNAFLFGIFSVLVLVILRTPFEFIFSFLGFSNFIEFFDTILYAPILEEISKGIVLYLLVIKRRNQFDNLLDYLIYGTIIGFSFEFIENILYLFDTLSNPETYEAWIEQLNYRLILFGGLHGFWTAWFGLGYWVIQNDKLINKKYYFYISILYPIILHFLNNLSSYFSDTIYNANYLLSIASYLVIIVLALVLDISILIEYGMKLQAEILINEYEDKEKLIINLKKIINPINHILVKLQRFTYRFNKEVNIIKLKNYENFAKNCFALNKLNIKNNYKKNYKLDENFIKESLFLLKNI